MIKKIAFIACALTLLVTSMSVRASPVLASADATEMPIELTHQTYTSVIPAIGGSTLTGQANIFNNEVVTAGTVGLVTRRTDTVPPIATSSIGHSIATFTDTSTTSSTYVEERATLGTGYSIYNNHTTWSNVMFHVEQFVLPSFFNVGDNDITFRYSMPTADAFPFYRSWCRIIPFTMNAGALSPIIRDTITHNTANNNLRYTDNTDYVEIYVDLDYPILPDNAVFYYLEYHIEFSIDYPNGNFFSNFFNWRLSIHPDCLSSSYDSGYCNAFVGARAAQYSTYPNKEFNVFGSIFNTVDEFLHMELFPNFRFIDILYIAFGLAVFSLLLKAFLGG